MVATKPITLMLVVKRVWIFAHQGDNKLLAAFIANMAPGLNAP
jgi:hypothetical protein